MVSVQVKYSTAHFYLSEVNVISISINQKDPNFNVSNTFLTLLQTIKVQNITSSQLLPVEALSQFELFHHLELHFPAQK